MIQIYRWCAAFFVVIGLFSSCVTTRSSRFPVSPVQVEVADGDTLNKLAITYDTTWRDIVFLNKETLKGGLRIGQILSIAPGPRAVPSSSLAPLSSRQMASDQRTLDQIEDRQEDERDEDGASTEDEDVKFAPRKKGLLFGGNEQQEEISFIFPVPGRITSHFGKRGRKLHKGIDFSANVGTPIRASAPGEVVFSGRRRGYGGTVVVDHGRFMTLYAHCSKMIARVGDVVKQGDYIAKSGRTGNARGAHLHFEIRDANNRPLDPETLLRHKPIAKKRSVSSLNQVARR